MTVYQLDVTCKMINKADRSQLKEIRSVLSNLKETGLMTYGMYSELNQDIRNRADWLRGRK